MMQIYFFKQQENNSNMSLAEILANKIVTDLFEKIRTNPANADLVKRLDANLKNPKVTEEDRVKKAVAALHIWINLPPPEYPVHYAPELCVYYDNIEEIKRERGICNWVTELANAIVNTL
jgi:hypothetical protein